MRAGRGGGTGEKWQGEGGRGKVAGEVAGEVFEAEAARSEYQHNT